MEVTINVSGETNGRCCFSVVFLNSSSDTVLLPAAAIKRSAARRGWSFFESGERIDPVDFKMINPARLETEIPMAPGESLVINMIASLEKKSANVCALIFDNATYKVSLMKKYTLIFEMGDFRSNEIIWEPRLQVET